MGEAFTQVWAFWLSFAVVYGVGWLIAALVRKLTRKG